MPGYKSPDPHKFERENYARYIEEKLPNEAPGMFGLHLNAEIGYLTNQGETLFQAILSVSGGSSSGGGSADDAVKNLITSLLEKLPSNFIMMDLMAKATKKTPYVVVCLQECERINSLLSEIRTSLSGLDAGLKGLLNITDQMEALQVALSINVVAMTW